jgi:hypothetical protein
MIYNKSDLEEQPEPYTALDMVLDVVAATIIFIGGLSMFWLFINEI